MPGRIAAAVLAVQVLALFAFAVFYVVELVQGASDNASRVVMSIVLILVFIAKEAAPIFYSGAVRAEVTLAAGSPAADQEIADLNLPRDSTVVAVVRNDRILVPRGDTLIRVGDEVLVLVTTDSEEEVRQILTGA